MRISYLELRNYRRFKDVRVQFPDGVVGIIGSNGAGKTTLIEGIAWALFGNTDEVVRTSRESIRRAGASASDSCAAVLEFELSGSGYRIEREMGGKNLSMKASLRTGDTVLAEGDKPVKKAVEKLIGMDHKSFFTSVFARQKELNALQNVAPGERKKAVLRMLRIDGIDGVIDRVRADRRDVEAKIKGAEGTLLDESGRDRETIIKAQLPEFRRVLDEAETLLKVAREKEASATKDFEEVRKQRDVLRKDSDAHDASAKDLHANRSVVAKLEQDSQRLEKKAADLKAKLSRLPELETAEQAWSQATSAVEKLEEERARFERARHIQDDLKENKAASEALAKELQGMDNAVSGDDIEEQKKALDVSRLESERTRADISRRIGELKANTRERLEAEARDRGRLDEILKLGKEGKCPTCERRLDEAYDLLAAKLRKDIEDAKAQAAAAGAETQGLQGQLKALDKRDEAIRKKARSIEQEALRRGKAEEAVKRLKGQLDQLKAKMAAKLEELSALGELTFSDKEYNRAKGERDRLRPLHEDFLRMKETGEELSRTEADRRDARERAAKLELEAEALSRLISELGPKKAEYEKVLKAVDEKTEIMSRAKDEAHSRAKKRDEAKAALQYAEKDLATIERVKKGIEQDRARRKELAALEDVMVSFKDDLIGRVRPTLGELTSHVLRLTTGDRYSRVEIGEDYEMQVDDEGTLHPVRRFSGGEADLANLALRLAISRIIAERTGANPINFLILDEIFGSLDPDRKRSVMMALSGLSAQFRQIFLITHIEDIKDLMGYVMRVEQTEDGTSNVALVS